MFGTRASQGYASVFTWPWDGKKNAGEALCRISSIGVLKLLAPLTVVVSGEENSVPKVSPIRIFEKKTRFYVRGDDGVERVLPTGSVRQLAHGGDVFNVCDVLTVKRIKIGTTIFDAVGCFGSSVSGADSIFYSVDVEKVGLPPDCGVVHLVDLLGQADGEKTSPAYSQPYRGNDELDKEEVVPEGARDKPESFQEVIGLGETIGDLEKEAAKLEVLVKYPPSQQYFFETEEEANLSEEQTRRTDEARLMEMRAEIKELRELVEGKVVPHENFILTGVKEGGNENAFIRKMKQQALAELAALKEADRVRVERDERHKRMGVSVEGGITKILLIKHLANPGVVEPEVRRRVRSNGRG